MNPRCILIARLSAIGDVILTLPILNALRDRFPGAVLAWVVEERAAAVLRGHKALDELITVPRGWLKSPGTVWRLRRRLRQLGPEIAIDPQGLSKSSIVAWLSGAKRRIGFRGQWGREISRWVNNETVLPATEHVIDSSLELLRPLGIERPDVRFDIAEDEADRKAAEEILHGLGFLPGGYAVINPGAGWASRRWPNERFAAVASYVGQQYSLPTLVVWAGDAERSMADSIAAASGGFARVAPSTRLMELAALARRSKIFVSTDTGPLHLAVAVGATCVSLHGPTRRERSGAYGSQNVAIQKMSCGSSSRERRNASSQLMEAIEIKDVWETCDQVLARSRTGER